jgi:hemolysin activation/secretion protein
MITKCKYIGLISFILSMSLSSYAGTNSSDVSITQGNVNNTSDMYKKTKNVRAANLNSSKDASSVKRVGDSNFEPFLVKRIAINFDNQELVLESISNDYINRIMTEELYNELKSKIVKYYIGKGYLLPRVGFVSQADSNLLQMNIVAISINEVVLVGDGESNDLMREYAAHITEQRPSMVSNTQKYLALMNKIPGYQIHYKLKEDGENVNLIVSTSQKKWSAYTGVDNYGLGDLGRYQTSALVQAFSPFGGSESLMVHGSTTNHPDRLSDYGMGYTQPINSYGTNLNLFAAHSQDNATKKAAIQTKDGTGNSFKAAITHHLLLKAHEDLEVEIGATYKNADTYKVDTDNIAKQNKYANFWVSELGLKYLFKDSRDGQNLFNISYVRGLSGKFQDYLDSTDNVNKNFNIGKFNFYRNQELAYNFSIFSHVAASYSGDNLPDAEKAILGGRDFGRGYDFGTLDGTKLAAISLEIRYTKKMEEESFIEHVQPYLFHDIGRVTKQDSDTNISTLQSVGGGVRFRLIYDIELGAEIAQPMKKNYIIEGASTKADTKYSFFINKVFDF